MSNRRMRANILLVITAIVWGVAFAFQKMGADYLGAFSFNGIRFLMAAVALMPVVYVFSGSPAKGLARLVPSRAEAVAGACAGLVLYTASFTQQTAIAYTTAGKVAFITGLYIVIVPIYGLFRGQKVHITVWAAIAMAVAGLYFLSINEKFEINKGDVIVFFGAFIWAGHILVVDVFNPRVDPLRFSWLQFIAASLLSLVTALLTERETLTFYNIQAAVIPLLYAGVVSAGVGYTLQIIAQKDARPAPATLIMSLETVFGAVGGYFLLREILGFRELLGCALMVGGTLLAQYKELTKPSPKS